MSSRPAPASSAARWTAMTAATAPSMRRGESFVSLLSRAPRESSPQDRVSDVAGQRRTAVVGQLLVDDELVEPGRRRAHPGGGLEELVDHDAVAVEHLERALPAIRVSGDLEHTPAQARRPNRVLDLDHRHASRGGPRVLPRCVRARHAGSVRPWPGPAPSNPY